MRRSARRFVKDASLSPRHNSRQVCNRLRNEHVKTSCHVREGVPRSLLTDVEWVWQILMNLVTNAAKYTYKGRFDVFVGYQNGHLELRVEDTGIGIDDTKKGGVFDMFVTHQRYSHNSHGIGLHSVKAKVDALGGSCEILDNLGGGTIFEVCKSAFRTSGAVVFLVESMSCYNGSLERMGSYPVLLSVTDNRLLCLHVELAPSTITHD